MFEPRQTVDQRRIEGFHREQRDQSHHGTDFHVGRVSVWQMQHIVKKTVSAIPQLDMLAADIVHSTADVYEMLKEFAGDTLVRPVVTGELERHAQHVEAVHAHPARGTGLLEVPYRRQRGVPIEDPDIVQAEKAALKNVLPLRIL